MARRTKDDEKILTQARDRFKRCVDWEATARQRYRDDIKFCNGDADNCYQWPNEVRKSREVEKRPVLTVNKTRQFCLNITNDAKQNKPAVKVRPVGNRATFEGAQVMEGIVRHIEYMSRAQTVYDAATETQVQGGIGYWRVATDYVDSESFDQEIYIRRIKDPLTVYLDPDINEFDGSDARFGFIYDMMPREQFEKEYPDLKDKIGNSANLTIDDWIDDDHVRIAEYFRRIEKPAELLAVVDPSTGETSVMSSAKLNKELLDAVLDDPNTQRRPLTSYEVQWFKIAGDKIIDRGTWPGETIPIVRVIGEETVIEGQMDRKGHTRALKDPQKIYNYWTSSGVEAVALQTKIPYVGAAQSIEGYEDYWRTANNENHSILPYNHKDDDGNPLPAPQRAQPPVMPQAYITGMQIASEEMRMVTGQYQADTGEPGNEKSGRAIMQRQRAGDNATYHYIDHLAIAIEYTGRILIDLIPKIYDTKRIIKIMGEDGVPSEVTIDPNARAEYIQNQAQTEEKIKIIFNPSFSKYSVQADIGPAYATRRQEAFAALTQIMSQSPEAMHIGADLLFKAADFPMADELADRFKRTIPPAVLGKGPSPEVQQLQQQNQQLMQHLQTLMQQASEDKMKHTATEQQKEIDAFKAETDRMKVLVDQLDPQQMALLTAQIVIQAMSTPMPPVEEQAPPVAPQGQNPLGESP